jgi:hypothetical protein
MKPRASRIARCQMAPELVRDRNQRVERASGQRASLKSSSPEGAIQKVLFWVSRGLLNDHEVFSCTTGVRVVTNLAGELRSVVGISPDPQDIVLTQRSARRGAPWRTQSRHAAIQIRPGNLPRQSVRPVGRMESRREVPVIECVLFETRLHPARAAELFLRILRK